MIVNQGYESEDLLERDGREHAQDLRGRQQGRQSRAALRRGRRRPLVFQNGGWAGQGKGLQATNSSSESQRKVRIPLQQCGRRWEGSRGPLRPGRSWAPSLCGWGAPAGFHPVPGLAPRFWTGLKDRCSPGLATALCGTTCGTAPTCTVSEAALSAHWTHSANVNRVPDPTVQLRRSRVPHGERA